MCASMCVFTYVVGLVKHHHRLLGEVLGDHVCNLGVQHVRVVEHHDVGLLELEGGEGEEKGGGGGGRRRRRKEEGEGEGEGRREK